MSGDTDEVYDHLAALRASVAADLWMTVVDAPIVAVFNELLTRAKALRPDARPLGVIENQRPSVRADTLLALADQILLTLERPPSLHALQASRL